MAEDSFQKTPVIADKEDLSAENMLIGNEVMQDWHSIAPDRNYTM